MSLVYFNQPHKNFNLIEWFNLLGGSTLTPLIIHWNQFALVIASDWQLQTQVFHLMWSVYTSYSAVPIHLLLSFIPLYVSIQLWHVNCMRFLFRFQTCFKQKVTHTPSAAVSWYNPQLDLRKPFEENWHHILTQAIDRTKCCVYWARFSLAHISWVVTLCHSLILSQGCIQNS